MFCHNGAIPRSGRRPSYTPTPLALDAIGAQRVRPQQMLHVRDRETDSDRQRETDRQPDRETEQGHVDITGHDVSTEE